jgi:hypothetical protein
MHRFQHEQHRVIQQVRRVLAAHQVDDGVRRNRRPWASPPTRTGPAGTSVAWLAAMLAGIARCMASPSALVFGHQRHEPMRQQHEHHQPRRPKRSLWRRAVRRSRSSSPPDAPAAATRRANRAATGTASNPAHTAAIVSLGNRTTRVISEDPHRRAERAWRRAAIPVRIVVLAARAGASPARRRKSGKRPPPCSAKRADREGLCPPPVSPVISMPRTTTAPSSGWETPPPGTCRCISGSA